MELSRPTLAWPPRGKQIREEDTDWRRWLLTKPYRAFDPRIYFEFRLYPEFSSGIADQWMSHGIDMVHNLLDDYFPKSVVAHGGVFAWRDGRETPDTFQALLEYPKGFLVSYSTSLGNDSDSFTSAAREANAGSWWKRMAPTMAIRSSNVLRDTLRSATKSFVPCRGLNAF